MPSSGAPIAGCTFDGSSPDLARVRITGELDASSVGPVQQAIRDFLKPEHRRVVLDLTDLSFIDSSGIRLLIQVIHAKKDVGEVTIINPRAGTARRSLEIVGLSRVASVVDADAPELVHQGDAQASDEVESQV